MYSIQRPGAMLRMRMWSMRPTWLMRLQQQQSYLRSFGAHFRNLRLPGMKGKGGKGREPETSGVELGGGAPPVRRAAEMGAVRQEIGQIHLIHGSGQRQVVHVGSAVGYRSIDVVLQEGHKPVRLRFVQDDSGADPTVGVALLSGVDKIKVDGRVIDRRSPATPVVFGSRIQFGSQTYTCELFASGEALTGTGLAVNCWTSAGLHYDLNQDAIGLAQHDSGAMFVIADGVNGGYAGEQVSAFAVKYFLLAFKRNVAGGFSWLEVLRQAMERVNKSVYEFGQRSPDHTGTTLTALVVRGTMAYAVHVGDSRLYLLRQGRVRKLTEDHVTPGRTIHAGDSVVVKHPRLSKAVGKNRSIAPDVFSFSLQPNDRLLLCTDGITDVVSDEALARLLRESPRVELPQELVRQANTREVPDNASAVVVDVLSQPVSSPWASKLAGDRVFDADRVFAASLDHPPAYETVFHTPRRLGRTLTVLVALFAAVVIVAFSLGRPAPATSADSEPEQPEMMVQPEKEMSIPLTVIPAVTNTPVPVPTVAADTTPIPTQHMAPTSTIRPSNQ